MYMRQLLEGRKRWMRIGSSSSKSWLCQGEGEGSVIVNSTTNAIASTAQRIFKSSLFKEEKKG
jgi:hypothetical protein